MSTGILEQAFAVAEDALANLPPDQMGRPTPCASWDVRGLVNHVVEGSYFCGLTAEAGEVSRPPAQDFAIGDFVGSHQEGARRSLAVFGAPGVLDQEVVLPFGALPCSVFMGIAATDQLVHGWDLAKATGRSTDLAPELAVELLARARVTLPDTLRGPDGQAPFGPEVPVGPDACPADRLAGFLGRSV